MDDIASSNSFPQFKEIDDVLKCGICYETLTTPVITSCSHTFCSICIRRWLPTNQICPSCNEATFETTLRKNTIVVNILDAVQNLKKKIFGKNGIPSNKSSCSSITPEKNSFSPKNEENDSNDFQPKIYVKKTPPPKPSHSASQPKRTPIPSQRSPVVQRSPQVKSTPGGAASGRPQRVDDDRSPAIKVACPICNVMMPQRLVFDHVGRCEPISQSSKSTNISCRNSSEMSSPKNGYTVKKNIAQSSTTADSNPPLEPIKKMVYHLLPDKQLKAVLKKYGLSLKGDRRTLLARLQRFVIMHNAECDSDTPRPVTEIIQQLEREEKAMSSASAVSTFSQMFKKSNNPEEIETVHKTYRIQNKTSYDKLVEEARKNNKKKKLPHVEEFITLSETEDDPVPLCTEPNPNPTPQAMSSRKVDSDDESDAPGLKTPHNRKNASKNIKRKCIESESEEDENEDNVFKRQRQEKREESTSPVLSRKTPARQLRSRTAQNKTANKQCVSPQISTRNSKRSKAPPKQKGKEWKEISSSDSDEGSCTVKENTNRKKEERRSPTPDLFDPLPSSGDIPCGQRTKKSENDALHALVEMIDNDDDDAGSTTDYEED